MKRPAIAVAVFLAACTGSEANPAHDAGVDGGGGAAPSLEFPASFLFGSSIAGFQVDMGCPTLPASSCDDPSSDWYQFITDPKTKDDGKAYIQGDPPSAGPGHWELY